MPLQEPEQELARLLDAIALLLLRLLQKLGNTPKNATNSTRANMHKNIANLQQLLLEFVWWNLPVFNPH